MAHFYFNVRSRGRLVADPEGQEFPSLAAARASALKDALQIMSAAVLTGKRPNGSQFEIMDDHGRVVLTVPFSDAFAAD